MEDNVKQWALAFFEKRKPIPGVAEDDKLKVDFFASGLLESIEVVELISEAEDQFGITFTTESMQDRRFCTIGGLAEIISELKQ